MTTPPSVQPARPVRITPWRRIGLATVVALTLIGFARVPAFAEAASTDPVVAKVNGVEIRQSDLALAEEDVGPNIPAGTPDAKRDWLINYLSDMMILAKNAETSNVGQSDEFKRRLTYLRQKALMETTLRNTGKEALTPDAMRAVYEEAVKQIGDEQEVHARHILFRVPDASDEKASKAAEDKAKAALTRIKKGDDFAAVAKELTEDPPGKQDGGDLGYFTKDQMVPEFSEKAFAMEKGQVSDPVKTAFGWHLIKIEDKRKRQPPEFEQVKEQIETFVTRKAQIDLLNKLRAEAKVERLDKPATPDAAAPATGDKPAAEPKKN